jgi:hypothetical protein
MIYSRISSSTPLDHKKFAMCWSAMDIGGMVLCHVIHFTELTPNRDWTLHSIQPEPAHPSYRVIAALRLIHLHSDSGAVDTRPWKDTIAGLRDNISDDNEVAWRVSLQQLCEAIQIRASSHLELEASLINANTSWTNWMQGNVRMLWEEEVLTARMVLDSLAAGLVEA